MDLTRGKLETLFDFLRYRQYDDVHKILDDASDEYRQLFRELNREEKRKVNYVMSMIDYCRTGKWILAGNQLGPAEEEYYKYFYRKRSSYREQSFKTLKFNLQPNERKGSSQFNKSNSTIRPVSETYPRGWKGDSKFDKNKITSRPASETYAQRKDMALGSNLLYKRKMPMRKRHVTDLRDLSDIQKIAGKLEEIYHNEWADALDELEHFKIDEFNSIKCLLKILLDAYYISVVEADTQITKLEDAASKILLEGAYATSYGEELKDQRSLLVRYRMRIANICVDRLQETFRRRYLPEIIRTVGVYQNLPIQGPVHTYASQCVAISWAMAVQYPQAYLADDRDRQRLFNREFYDTYTRSGQSVDFFVWPPLLTHKNGKLVSKGIAQGL
ncbi:uncharacterized protein LOC132749743 [Ruditapes philippinarum]|uniref:uncharacterized protein LOC132749743 n=1 Tax=Ruditapes philippinarum TaxID=129788 RepID=UPI00295A5DEA|nr:uncharacterized protein LOC132749743 [Ruditapes philippinarum]